MKAQTDDRSSWRPVIHDPSDAEQRARLELLFDDPRVVVHDAIEDQLTELVASLEPARSLPVAERAERIRAHVGERTLADYGRWVFFPWSRRLVHLLPPDEYFALRTDRNHHKITTAEQRALRERTIGVVGLSVGQATAVTLAMEGVGGVFRLADFDVLSLSNMNRLRSGAHNIGVPKVVLAAREIFEIDPYLDVQIFPKGLEEHDLDAFLLGPSRLDLLVEECDDLMMKIRVREHARKNRIPVVMETSDRGMIDVERFDLEPGRALLHGLVGDLRAEDVRGMSTMDKVPYVMRILDDRRVSKGIAGSILEVKQSISTWPQLASAVALGGAVVTDVARRILLGVLDVSGRYYVDLDDLVGPGRAVDVTPAPMTAELPAVQPARAVPKPAPRSAPDLTRDEVRYLAHHATLAPSRDNRQPWRFEWTGEELLGHLDVRHADEGADGGGDRADAQLALGAAAQNIVLAAGALGLIANLEPFPRSAESAVVFSARFARSPEAKLSELFALLPERTTNRRIGERRALDDAHRRRLIESAREGGVELALVEETGALAEIGVLLARAERHRYLSPALHAARARSLRWSAREADETRTGIDVATLELDATRLALLRLASRADAMETVRRAGGGAGLGMTASAEIAACSAVGLLRARADGPSAFFEGGRALQRLWLRATASGLALQPYDLFSLAREADDAGDGTVLAGIASDVARVLGSGGGGAGPDLALFRVAYASGPSARSFRRPLDEVLSFVKRE
jgi:molybdopterin/thiamine biosynthesis adenylyltransferase